MNLAKNRVLFSAGVGVIILLVAAGTIFFARGFKLDVKNKRIDHTGLIVATSIPTGAQVYLDDRLTSATNTSIAYLAPKNYKVRITKDGYTSWEKEIEIKADLATEINVLLFPLAPEIKPLTITGAASPTLSPNGSKIIYGVSGERGGLYYLSMSDSPIPFRQDTHQVAKNTPTFDFSKAKFTWDADSKQVIASFYDTNSVSTSNLLLNTDASADQDIRDITGSLTSTLASWQDQINQKAQSQSVIAPDSVKGATATAQIASPVPSPLSNLQNANVQAPTNPASKLNYYPTGLIFSPDEEKILYKTKDQNYKIYDLKTKKEYTMPNIGDFIAISWFPDSAHLLVAQKDLISVLDFDGTNKTTVYSGKFDDGFVFVHPTGTRLIILTHLAQPDGTPPNLYSVNLR